MASPCNAAQSIKAFTWIVCTVYGRRASRSLSRVRISEGLRKPKQKLNEKG